MFSIERILTTLVVLFLSSFIYSQTSLIITPGERAITYGWADESRLYYQDKSNYIIIDDITYPDSVSKRKAFTNAIASGDVADSEVNEKNALVILCGFVDLSDGLVSDKDHSYFDEYDKNTYKRVHDDIVYRVGANKTILGNNNAVIAFGGLRICADDNNSASNIIIRNITFYDAHGSTEFDNKIDGFSDSKTTADALSIEATGVIIDKSGSHYEYVPSGIWIDHCSFSDGECNDLISNNNHDGLIDIKAARNMTVSYCDFTNHDAVMLISPSDKFKDSKERNITLHHNYFHNCVQRMPRSRGANVYMYNNVFDSIGIEEKTGYSIAPGVCSYFVIENNCFINFANNHSIIRFFDPTDSTLDLELSKIYQKDNNIRLTSNCVSYDYTDNLKNYSIHSVFYRPFRIPYHFRDELTSWQIAYERVVMLKSAGAGKNLIIK